MVWVPTVVIIQNGHIAIRVERLEGIQSGIPGACRSPFALVRNEDRVDGRNERPEHFFFGFREGSLVRHDHKSIRLE